MGISVVELLVERMDIWWLYCADVSGGGFDTLFCFVADVLVEWICGLRCGVLIQREIDAS